MIEQQLGFSLESFLRRPFRAAPTGGYTYETNQRGGGNLSQPVGQ